METIRFGARLRAARKAAGFKTSKAFIKKYKVPASTYSQHESGARFPDEEKLKFYSKIFLVDFDWLKEGKGLPYKTANISLSNDIFEEELIDLNQFKSSPPLDQHLLMSILTEVLTIHAPKISTQNVKTIIIETIKIYKALSSLDRSSRDQMKILNLSTKKRQN